MRELFLSLVKDSGMTLMISSHILDEIEHIADTIGVIADGGFLRFVRRYLFPFRNSGIQGETRNSPVFLSCQQKKVFFSKLALVSLFTAVGLIVSNLIVFSVFLGIESVFPLV